MTAGTRVTTPFAAEEGRTAQHYAALHAAHGDSWRTLDWGSREGQWRRFEVLADAGLLDGMRVLDVGCGLAHFADWCITRGFTIDYTGLDLSADLVATAAKRHPAAHFVLGSVTDASVLSYERFDLVVSSGIFCSYPAGGEQFLHAAVTRMWQWSTRGVAFNSLSAWAPQRDPNEFYADPAAVAAFCGMLTPRIVLRHDYHPRDFTMHLLHSGVVA